MNDITVVPSVQENCTTESGFGWNYLCKYFIFAWKSWLRHWVYTIHILKTSNRATTRPHHRWLCVHPSHNKETSTELQEGDEMTDRGRAGLLPHICTLKETTAKSVTVIKKVRLFSSDWACKVTDYLSFTRSKFNIKSLWETGQPESTDTNTITLILKSLGGIFCQKVSWHQL